MNNTRATCIHCGSPVATRGLCNAHYMQFRRFLEEMPPEKAEKFEARAIAERKILPSRTGKPSDANVFADLAESVCAEGAAEYASGPEINAAAKKARESIDTPAKPAARKKPKNRSGR